MDPAIWSVSELNSTEQDLCRVTRENFFQPNLFAQNNNLAKYVINYEKIKHFNVTV